MPENEIGIRRLNYDIPREYSNGFKICQNRQRQAEEAIGRGHLSLATDLLKNNLMWCKRHLSTDPIHPMTLWHLTKIGIQLVSVREFKEAITYLTEAYNIWDELDPQHKDDNALITVSHYAQALAGDGHMDLAAGKFETLWRAYERVLGPEAETTLKAGHQAAQCFFHAAVNDKRRTVSEEEKAKLLTTAQRIYKVVLDTWESIKPATSLDVIETRAGLATNYAMREEYQVAESLFKRCLDDLNAVVRDVGQRTKEREIEGLCRAWIKSFGDLTRRREQQKKRNEGPCKVERTPGEEQRNGSSREIKSTQNETARGEEVRTERSRTRGTPPKIGSEEGQASDPTSSGSVAQTPPHGSQQTKRASPQSADGFPENPPNRKRPSPSPDSLEKPPDQEHCDSSSTSPNPEPGGWDLATLGEDVLDEQSNGTSAKLPEASELTTEAEVDDSISISQGVDSGPNTSGLEPVNPIQIPPAVRGSICDATPQLVNDASVDMWFADIERINEEIFQPYRRQACKRVKVGILDTGIDMKNAVFQREEVRSRIKKRVDFCDPNGKESCRDRCGHGTHCTALINRIAPAADIYVGRVAVDFDSGLDENVVAKAICVALGYKGPGEASQNWDVDILSLPLGFQHFSEAIDVALRSSASRGKIVLAAASNNGTLRTMAYPAWDPNVIPINSANARGQPSDFNPLAMPGKTLTFLGENVPSAWITTNTRATTTSTTTTTTTTATTDLAARSELDDKNNNNNLEAANPETTRRMSGTSVATPIAAGLVALLFELTTIQVGDDEAAAQATLRAVLPTIRRQVGLQWLLAGRAVKTGDFHNVVPRALLNPDLTVGENAAVIKGVLASCFGFRT
ncbi:peptidase S8/S53 domain-containing protein [Corynascus novoguineensis]|uniref:Peptidase S8/S53 domain-containing protein n=1 Tax=Corynascus novoguineensis TaxID=1126955 RepID=A0AAN7CJU1_9PEZI|nr:peptidase S8/S53 domain-containing protein [Corynascus novoguineensis]